MKKFLFILIILISGCSKGYRLNIDNIQTISYDNINLIESDFELIKKKINKLEFKKKEIDETAHNVLRVVSSQDIYNFNISNDIIYYKKNNETYVSGNKSINTILNEIKTKYTDTSFFEVSYDKCDNANIKIDNSSKCLILETSKILYNFKINSISMTHDYLEETDLLYEKDEVKSNEIMIRVDILDKVNIKISFDTKYNYTISMLPIYNIEENKLNLNLTSVQKK